MGRCWRIGILLRRHLAPRLDLGRLGHRRLHRHPFQGDDDAALGLAEGRRHRREPPPPRLHDEALRADLGEDLRLDDARLSLAAARRGHSSPRRRELVCEHDGAGPCCDFSTYAAPQTVQRCDLEGSQLGHPGQGLVHAERVGAPAAQVAREAGEVGASAPRALHRAAAVLRHIVRHGRGPQEARPTHAARRWQESLRETWWDVEDPVEEAPGGLRAPRRRGQGGAHAGDRRRACDVDQGGEGLSCACHG